MGLSSREKWIKRAATYEQIVAQKGHAVAKVYLDQFKGKLERFMKGMEELAYERVEEEKVAAMEGTGTLEEEEFEEDDDHRT